MISANINLDKLLADIDAQIEVLIAIAGDNAILTEQLRLLLESREAILNQEMEIERLADMVDPDDDNEGMHVVDFRQMREEDERNA